MSKKGKRTKNKKKSSDAQAQQKLRLLSFRTDWRQLVLTGLMVVFGTAFMLWGGLAPGLALLVGAVLLAGRLLRLETGERVTAWTGRLFWVLAPLVGFYTVELMNNNVILEDLTKVEILLNLVWYYLFACVVFLIVGRTGLSAGLTASLSWAIGCINHYIIHFRGRSIFPVDLLTLRTAANVAGSYSYEPCETQAKAMAVLMVFLALLSLRQEQKKRRMVRWQISVPVGVLFAAYIGVFALTPMVDMLEIEPSLWTTRGNGFVLNFTVCMRYSKMEKPEGYSAAAAEELASDTEEKTGSVDVTPTNIIVIMDEAFSDLSVDGDLTVNGEMMPFISSLTENTIKGYAYSSVFGGTTANSEYEFLTGNSMAFLPAGSVPYQLFVRSGENSLVEQLEALGYSSTAMHPYKKSGWNRTQVYPSMGFDNILFQDDLADVEYVRDYISDQSDFENLIRLYEEKEEGSKFFLFNVTMQNHSAYNLEWTNLEKTVTLSGDLAGTSNWANQYLSLVHATDEACEYLINYFSQVDEPTIILLFGDHQPQLSTDFYSKLMGGDINELDAETLEKRYETVFCLWANYDIPEAEDVDLSINYLSTLLLEQTNLPLSGYQSRLADLMEVLPVIHATGYWDAEGNYYETEDDLPEDLYEQVNDYNILQYNNIGDRKNTVDDFFG